MDEIEGALAVHGVHAYSRYVGLSVLSPGSVEVVRRHDDVGVVRELPILKRVSRHPPGPALNCAFA